MTCFEIKKLFPDHLTGDLDEDTRHRLQTHLSDCASCREELENLSAVWTKLGVLPEEQPSPTLRARFYTLLEAHKRETEPTKRPSVWLRTLVARASQLWPRRPAYQLSLALVFLAFGLTAGYVLRPSGPNRQAITTLRQEVHSMRQTLAVTLLKQPSPGERLKGIGLSSETQHPEEGLLEALVQTLDSDPNVNVRLAAVDALYLFAENPKVKAELILSLTRQTSPLVQVALVDLLVSLRERRAAAALQQLIRDENLNPEVKLRAEQGLAVLSF